MPQSNFGPERNASLDFTLDFGQVGWQIQGVVGHDRW
jgi:hypothetical protein